MLEIALRGFLGFRMLSEPVRHTSKSIGQISDMEKITGSHKQLNACQIRDYLLLGIKMRPAIAEGLKAC